MTTTNKELSLIWDELEDIFKDFHKFKNKHVERLTKLGYKVVYNSKHPKLYIKLNNITHCITISTTPSDRYAGKQILRQIRRIYENN